MAILKVDKFTCKNYFWTFNCGEFSCERENVWAVFTSSGRF